MKKVLLYLGLAILLLLFGAIIFEATQPRPYNWSQSYDLRDRQPYGSYVLEKQFKNFFPKQRVRELMISDLAYYYDFLDMDDLKQSYNSWSDTSNTITGAGIHDLLYDLENEEDSVEFNLFGFARKFYMTKRSERAFWMHLYQGNNALVVSENLQSSIKEFLGIKVRDYGTSDFEDTRMDSLYKIQFKEHPFQSYNYEDSFTEIDSIPEGAEVIARNIRGDIVGVKIKVGKGSFTYFSVPLIFTNYNLLKGDKQIVDQLLRELPVKDTYYFSFIYEPRDGGRSPKRNTPGILSFIHSNKALSWAFYLLLFSILTFMFFQLRRKQRMIPVVKPPENMSLKFTETLGNLYLAHDNHKDVALKKMNYFLAFVHQEYHIDTSEINENFYKRLSSKSGVSIPIIKELFIKYHYVKARHKVTQEDFVQFCHLLQHFKK